jgi:hypothetical protein
LFSFRVPWQRGDSGPPAIVFVFRSGNGTLDPGSKVKAVSSPTYLLESDSRWDKSRSLPNTFRKEKN